MQQVPILYPLLSKGLKGRGEGLGRLKPAFQDRGFYVQIF